MAVAVPACRSLARGRGEDVQVVVREAEDVAPVVGVGVAGGVERVEGDVERVAVVAGAVQGVAVVVVVHGHTSAVVVVGEHLAVVRSLAVAEVLLREGSRKVLACKGRR